MTSRKAIFAALFALARTSAGFVTTSRALKVWDDVAPADQPALYQVEGKQVAVVLPRTPTKWTFHAELVIYTHEQNATGGADVVDLLNDLVDAVVAALAPRPGESQTLGGLVTDCRIDGSIDTSEGRLGHQAVAIIPILIIANA